MYSLIAKKARATWKTPEQPRLLHSLQVFCGLLESGKCLNAEAQTWISPVQQWLRMAEAAAHWTVEPFPTDISDFLNIA